MRNVGLALAAAGPTYADIVKITTFVVDCKPEHRAVIGLARAPFPREGQPPASTLVGVSALALPGWLVEVEAVAVVARVNEQVRLSRAVRSVKNAFSPRRMNV